MTQEIPTGRKGIPYRTPSGPAGRLSEEGVADAQRPVAGGTELGELALDVDLDGTKKLMFSLYAGEM